MSDMTVLARPYARAAFQWAQDTQTLQEWEDQLALLAMISRDERVHVLLGDPRVDRDRKSQFMLDIAGNDLSGPVSNLVRLLGENGRLLSLPDIHSEFAALKSATEQRVSAHVISSHPVTAAQQETLRASLETRLGRAVDLECTVDESLLGGVVIRAGDLVIDGSVRGQLNRLAAILSR